MKAKNVVMSISLMLLLAHWSVAQPINKKAKTTWGQEMRATKRSTLSDIVGHDETGVYAIRFISKGLYGLINDLQLEHYDQNMNLTTSTEIEMKYEEGKRNLEFILHLNDQLYLFSSYKDQKQKKNILFVQEIDKKSLKPRAVSRQLAAVDYEGHRKKNSGNFQFSISRDSSNFLVYYDMPYEKRESERFGFHVLDGHLTSLWEKQITLPYQEELFDTERFKVDNQGNVHLLGQIYYEKRKEKRRGEVNYKYQVLSYRDKGNTLTEYPITLDDLYISDMQIDIRDNQDIICAGFYSENEKSSIKGSYFLTVDGKTKAVKQKNHKPFEADFITQNMKKGKAKRTTNKIEKGKNVELEDYDLNNIILRDDGGAVLTAEQYYITVRTTTNNQGITHTTYMYHYNDIIVVNINPLGNIEWAQKIPKRQISTNDGGFFSSYVTAVVDDKLYFIFNDNPKNMVSKPGKTYPLNLARKSAIVAMVEVDAQGRQHKDALFMRYDAEVITRPKVCEQIATRELIIFGQFKRSQKLGKIQFTKPIPKITSNGGQ